MEERNSYQRFMIGNLASSFCAESADPLFMRMLYARRVSSCSEAALDSGNVFRTRDRLRSDSG